MQKQNRPYIHRYINISTFIDWLIIILKPKPKMKRRILPIEKNVWWIGVNDLRVGWDLVWEKRREECGRFLVRRGWCHWFMISCYFWFKQHKTREVGGHSPTPANYGYRCSLPRHRCPVSVLVGRTVTSFSFHSIFTSQILYDHDNVSYMYVVLSFQFFIL